MSGAVVLLAEDWERLRRAYPDANDVELARAALSRGRRAVQGPAEIRVPADLLPGERIGRLRMLLASSAGAAAVLRLRMIVDRERDVRAEREEIRTYERHLELEKDLVPPLKLEAQRLRAELRTLEREAREAGIDVGSIEPRIHWPETIAVDDYRPPRYQSHEERRRAAVEFFRRVGGP